MYNSMSEPLVCLPGERLCLLDEGHVAGQGTYERQGYIYSNLAGVVDVVNREEGPRVVEVRAPGTRAVVVPGHGDLVTAQVHTITQTCAKCLIKCVGDTVLRRPLRGVLKKEDVRATEKDSVEIYKSFRPGDIILARVLPVTEAHSYQLSTAENSLGVVTAHSEHGHPMVPVGWSMMQCSKTFIKEPRKVAKVAPETAST